MGLIGYAINTALSVLSYAIIINVLISWIPNARGNNTIQKLSDILSLITEPVLKPIRSILDKLLGDKLGMIDLSPMAALFLIMFLRWLVSVLL